MGLTFDTLNDVFKRKNYLYVITRFQNSCLITFLKKNTEAATGGADAVTGGFLLKNVFQKISLISQENTCVEAFLK